MNERRCILLGFLVSLAFHGMVVIPLLERISNASEARGIVDLASAIEPPAPEENETVLGIDDSMAKTMNWIGYEEYEEHLARLAETDQAAFKMNPSAGGGAPPPVPETTRPPVERTVPASERSPEGSKPSVTAPMTKERNTPRAPDAPEPAEATTVEKTAPVDPEEAPGEQPVAPTTEPAPEAPETEPQTEPVPEQPPQPESDPKPAPTPTPSPNTGPGEGDGEPADGDAAEKESDATSVIEVPPSTWRAGKPLAAGGLELKTRRPVFTELTTLTAQFSNPLVEIRFGRDGRPRSAVILESSRDRRVDEPILDSLYRWRATGDRLKELEGDKTVDIRLRIILR